MVVQLKVNTPRGDDVFVDVCEDERELSKITVEKLGFIVSKTLRIESKLWLVYQGETLEGSKTLAYYKIHHMSKVQSVLVLPGGF